MGNKILAALFATAALTAAKALALVDGIDVSHWQQTVNWTSVKNDGIDFAFVKATEGVNFIDSRFHQNMQAARSAGVYVGPYHFARIDSFNGVPFTQYDGSPFAPGSDPYVDAVSEANDFLDAITPYYNTGLHLPPVADVEGLPDFNNTTLEREFISNWVQLFSDTINDSLGRRPVIYTSRFGANTRYTPAVAASHDLWLAWWKGTGTSDPPTVADTPLWNPWQFWQYTATGSVAGVGGNVDRDVFDGTLLELEQLLIGNGPTNPGGLVTIADFEIDEGYFNWATNHSGSTQGIGDGSSAMRVTTEAHQGIGSQQIVIEGDSGGWLYRHLSGIGAPPASPETNLALEATGHVGFWLQTTDSGLTVQLAVDDPVTGDRGVLQEVIADGQWHLYEWDLGDDSQWEAWFNGDGIITGPTVTLDSIQFRGAGDATFFLDSVAHNPLGSLAPRPGDLDGDGDVDADDLAHWQQQYAVEIDANGGQFLVWQRNFAAAAGDASASGVPEPTTIILLACATGFLVRRRPTA